MLRGLKTVLDEEGFKPSWTDPRFHADDRRRTCQEPVPCSTLYVHDLPILRVVPFDFSMARLRFQEDRLLFELLFLYREELAQRVDAEEIREVCERHDTQWAPRLAARLLGPAERYSLRWDTEYDDEIEDSLYGWIDPSATAVLSLLREIIACMG